MNDVRLLRPFVAAFSDELQKIANLSGGQSDLPNPNQLGTYTPKSVSKPGGKMSNYTKSNSGGSTSQIAQHQPTLAAPPVKT